MGNQMRGEIDPEAQHVLKDLFSDRQIRSRFLRKVFCIIFLQLVVVAGVFVGFYLSEDLQEWLQENSYMRWVCFGVLFALCLIISCCETPRRKFPINYVLLFLFTLALAFLFTFMLIFIEPDIVLMAFGTTAAVVLILGLIAFVSRIDFTKYYLYLIVVTLVLMIFGIVLIFIHDRIAMIVYCALGVLVFSIWLLIDLQMMLGGKHMLQVSPEDYVLAALCIFTDVMTLFAFILGLFVATNN